MTREELKMLLLKEPLSLDHYAIWMHDQAQRERIERLEARLSIAVSALQSIATPALGGKSQQYTAQHALKALEPHEREEAR